MARNVSDTTRLGAQRTGRVDRRRRSRAKHGRSAPSTRRSRSTAPTPRRCPTPASAASEALLRWASRPPSAGGRSEDGEALIGLSDPRGGAISLEPGGQFELPARRCETVHRPAARCSASDAVKRRRRAARRLLSDTRHSPLWRRDETPVMPRAATASWRAYMPKVGTARPRHDVPHRDRAGEPRFRLRARHGAQTASASRCNRSPPRFRQLAFRRGQALRLLCHPLPTSGTDTDRAARARCPRVRATASASRPMSTTPSMCRCIRQARRPLYRPTPAGRSAPLMACPLPALPGSGRPSTTGPPPDHHFPEVRLKKFLEMRGADTGPWPPVRPARAVDRAALRRCSPRCVPELVRNWMGRGARAICGLEVPRTWRWTRRSRKGSVEGDVAPDVVADRPHEGRAQGPRPGSTGTGQDETRYLDQAGADRRRRAGTPAERLLDLYRGPWNGSVEPAFRECVF